MKIMFSNIIQVRKYKTHIWHNHLLFEKMCRYIHNTQKNDPNEICQMLTVTIFGL